MAKTPPYELVNANNGTSIGGGTSQIAYGIYHKIHHTIPPWPVFNNSVVGYVWMEDFGEEGRVYFSFLN